MYHTPDKVCGMVYRVRTVDNGVDCQLAFSNHPHMGDIVKIEDEGEFLIVCVDGNEVFIKEAQYVRNPHPSS